MYDLVVLDAPPTGRLPRFHVATGLRPGAHLELPQEVAHHAAAGLRMRAGESLTLFDGTGGEYEAKIASIGRGGIVVAIGPHQARERESPLAITLAQGIAGADRMDFIIQKAVEDRAIVQVANVATLPGIVRASLAMPDIHWGYGFPIGGVAATDADGDGTAGGTLRFAFTTLSTVALPGTTLSGRLADAGIRVVVNTCHGLWAQADDPLPRRAVVLAAEALAARVSDAELYQNDLDRRTLARWVPASRARTVGNGIDLHRFRPDVPGAAAFRADLGLGDADLLVGGVGRQVAEKGIHELAAAAHSLRDRARFIWVGPEDEDKPDAVQGEVTGIDFLGLRSDLPAIYTALDVFVLPSHREGFSRSAMEAWACGAAMILTDIRGCREIGTADEELLLVPPRDDATLTAAIRRLLDDPQLRARLGAAARHRAQRCFDQRDVAAASIKTYRRVAARKGLVEVAALTVGAPA